MNLIWHLIKKDLRATRIWLILWVAACATHLALRLIQLASGDSALPQNFASTGRPDHLALYVLMLLVAPQIVQLDPPVSGRSFWKTLPIARWRLLSAKLLLLIALFVVLPAACEFAYFASAGFGEHTWAAVSIWAWRALPPVALVLGASVLSRDLRITALIVAAAAIMLPVGGLNFLFTGWRPEVMRFAIPFSVVTVAAIGVGLLVWQYLSAGRFKWAILVALVGVGWWNKAGMDRARNTPLGYPGTSPQVKNPGVIPMPDGMRVDLSPLPPSASETNYTDRDGTKWKGTGFTIAYTVTGLPPNTNVFAFDIANLELIIDGQSQKKRSYRWTHDGVAEKPPTSVTVGDYDLEGLDWKSKHATLKGTLRFRQGRTTKLASVPVQSGILWGGKLDSLVVKSITKDSKSFTVKTVFSTVDMPETLQLTEPQFPTFERWKTPGFMFVRKDGTRRQNFGTLSKRINPKIDLLDWGPSGGRSYIRNPNTGELTTTPGVKSVEWRTDLTRRVREYPGLSTLQEPQTSGNQKPLLAQEREAALYRNLDDWEIQLLMGTPVGEPIEIPFSFTNINPPEAQWIHAKNRETESLGETLAAIVLKNAPAPADVEEYVRKLCLATRVSSGAHIEHHENTILVKLYSVGAENIPTLIRWAKLHTTPLRTWESIRSQSDGGWKLPARGEPAHQYDRPSTSTINACLIRVINDLARPTDKDLLLAEHSPALDFQPAIFEHGWEKEAIAVMCDRASDEPLPAKWTDMLLASDSPKVNAAIVAQCRIGGIALEKLERASQREGFPTREAVSALWHSASERVSRPLQIIHLFAFLCKHGGAAAPGDLALILADDSNRAYADENAEIEGEMARIMSWRSDCPPTAEAARIWLNKNAANMRFSDATGRYELTNSNP